MTLIVECIHHASLTYLSFYKIVSVINNLNKIISLLVSHILCLFMSLLAM